MAANSAARIADDLPTLAAFCGPGFEDAPPEQVAELLMACVAAQPIDKLDGLSLVRLRAGLPPLAIIGVTLDGHSYILTADHGRRVALDLDAMHRKGAALDLLALCDGAEEAAAKICRVH